MPDRSTPPKHKSTHRLERRSVTVVNLQRCTVTVIEGPDRGTSSVVEGRPLTIGKGPGCDLQLTDAAVSRSHAVISPGPDGLLIEDLGSKNGTEINGVSIKTAVLRPGSRVLIGTSVLDITSEVQQLIAIPSTDSKLEGIVGASAVMRKIYGLLKRVAPTEATVVLEGETGTGKEVVAHAIHALSRRKAGPFVVLDCANINRDLLGSELFGHEKGAFTGALSAHQGAFDRAHKGTLFLDEIGELPLDLQTRLLGVLQRREVQPLGSGTAHPIDTRVIAATHRNLDEMCRSGAFREDLYFRLAVITIDLPPLRERQEDMPLLVDHFLRELTPRGESARVVSPEGMAYLQQQPWKGNIRELANVIQRAIVLAEGTELTVSHLRSRRSAAPVPAAAVAPPLTAPAPPPANPAPGDETLEAMERKAIEAALQRHDGNKSQAARQLGVAVSTLRRKLAQYGLGDGEDHD